MGFLWKLVDMQRYTFGLKCGVGRGVRDVLHVSYVYVSYMYVSYAGLWEGSKLLAYLKIKGSLTWCLVCFPKKAITCFNPEVCEIYALHVSVLCTLFCFRLDLTN